MKLVDDFDLKEYETTLAEQGVSYMTFHFIEDDQESLDEPRYEREGYDDWTTTPEIVEKLASITGDSNWGNYQICRYFNQYGPNRTDLVIHHFKSGDPDKHSCGQSSTLMCRLGEIFFPHKDVLIEYLNGDGNFNEEGETSYFSLFDSTDELPAFVKYMEEHYGSVIVHHLDECDPVGSYRATDFFPKEELVYIQGYTVIVIELYKLVLEKWPELCTSGGIVHPTEAFKEALRYVEEGRVIPEWCSDEDSQKLLKAMMNVCRQLPLNFKRQLER